MTAKRVLHVVVLRSGGMQDKSKTGHRMWSDKNFDGGIQGENTLKGV